MPEHCIAASPGGGEFVRRPNRRPRGGAGPENPLPEAYQGRVPAVVTRPIQHRRHIPHNAITRDPRGGTVAIARNPQLSSVLQWVKPPPALAGSAKLDSPAGVNSARLPVAKSDVRGLPGVSPCDHMGSGRRTLFVEVSATLQSQRQSVSCGAAQFMVARNGAIDQLVFTTAIRIGEQECPFVSTPKRQISLPRPRREQ